MILSLAACGTFSPSPTSTSTASPTITQAPVFVPSPRGTEVVLFAMGLLDTGYRYGGKNPQAGLDCSGMVTHVYREALGMKVTGSAADIAKRSRPVEQTQMQPGDLVFFNTANRAFSHVGIYIGEQRFVHAPSSNGKVRVDRLTDRYYAARLEAVHTLLN